MSFTSYMVKVLVSLLIIFATVTTLFPIYWMFLTSIAPGEVVMTYPPRFIPHTFTIKWWSYAISTIKGPLINSLVIAGTASIISSMLGFIAGYGFARFRKPNDNVLFWILSIRFMPAIVAIIPYYLLFSSLNLLDTYPAVIIPHLTIGIPFAVWLLRGAIIAIPRELEEAALVDGCNRWQALFKVVFPLALPSILVTLLFTFIWSWNEFMYALVLTDVKARVLTVAIAGMREAHGLMWGAVSAAAIVAALPALTITLLLQRHLISGLAFYRTKG